MKRYYFLLSLIAGLLVFLIFILFINARESDRQISLDSEAVISGQR